MRHQALPTTGGDNPGGALSRADVESLVILDAVGSQACTPAQLAARLELAAELAPFLVDALEDLVASGWLARPDEQIGTTYVATEDGRAWTDERLRAAGLR